MAVKKISDTDILISFTCYFKNRGSIKKVTLKGNIDVPNPLNYRDWWFHLIFKCPTCKKLIGEIDYLNFKEMLSDGSFPNAAPVIVDTLLEDLKANALIGNYNNNVAKMILINDFGYQEAPKIQVLNSNPDQKMVEFKFNNVIDVDKDEVEHE